MQLEPAFFERGGNGGGRTDDAGETTAAPVDVITRDEIDERQADLAHAAARVGARREFFAAWSDGRLTTFFLDGGNSNYTKVLVDGAPVNQPGGSIDFSNFTLDSIDKIEVVHGASSALYGSDAMDGVIQIFTHRGSTRTPELILEGTAERSTPATAAAN